MPAHPRSAECGRLYGGRKKGGGGAQTKVWLLAKMRELLENLTPEEFRAKLMHLLDTDTGDYLRIMVMMMPKDTKVDITMSRFAGWTDAQLQNFIVNGQYPDDDDTPLVDSVDASIGDSDE